LVASKIKVFFAIKKDDFQASASLLEKPGEKAARGPDFATKKRNSVVWNTGWTGQSFNFAVMKKIPLSIAILLCHVFLSGQPLEQQLGTKNQEIEALQDRQTAILTEVEDLKLQMIRRDLKRVGLPGDDYVEHSAMLLSYAEAYEQARWVAHIISPAIAEGTVFRTNDFREDPLIPTGSATEADYFLKYLEPDSTYRYDGFGYDRGHLAPSADFRWSARALSESFYYSNMSPQVAAFNREGWASLEDLLRRYVIQHPGTQLYVVTGAVLEDNLPVIERGIHHVAIPRQFFKVALDLNTGQAIGFVLPNQAIRQSLAQYAMTVDEVEQLTGLDFFSLIDNQEAIESRLDKMNWLPALEEGDVEPIYPPDLPKDHFNTEQARQYMGTNQTITVVGKVVGSRYSRSGNLWLNLDKQYPNQIFSVYIKKDDLVNFDVDPKIAFDQQLISVKGEVDDLSGIPTINVEKSSRIATFVLPSEN